MHNKINRRTFTKQSAIFSAPLILPVSAKGANERLNIGVVGVGGKGGHNLAQVGGENIVAVCDVDRNRLAGAKNQHPKAVEYTDYRKLIERNDIDAVWIEQRIEDRRLARINKDFEQADHIRDELSAAGIRIEDSADGTTWHPL